MTFFFDRATCAYGRRLQSARAKLLFDIMTIGFETADHRQVRRLDRNAGPAIRPVIRPISPIAILVLPRIDFAGAILFSLSR
jgi:hypothetical protein